MTAPSEAGAATTAVRERYQIDAKALDRWMKYHVEGFAGPLTIDQFQDGQSNATYKLTTPERSYVLRRKPPGQLLKGAHAVDRAAKVLMALGTAGFPVAHVYGLCTDETVIGTWFYVMAMVEGRIFWDATMPGMSPDARAAHFDAMDDAIAKLHSVDFEAVGLADFGRSGNYFERQIARWSKQYVEDAEAGRDPNMDRLDDWLPRNIPAGEETSIVHGDFRCDNMIFHPTEPRILAVLDWELSTLGHPGAGFAYHAMMFRMPPHIVAGLGGADTAPLGISSEADYLSAYCVPRGMASMRNCDFYIAFNFFRLAAIFHGIKGRVLRGTASSSQARERVAVLPELMAIAWGQAERAGGSG